MWKIYMEFYLVVSEIKENKSDQSNLKFYKFLKGWWSKILRTQNLKIALKKLSESVNLTKLKIPDGDLIVLFEKLKNIKTLYWTLQNF